MKQLWNDKSKFGNGDKSICFYLYLVIGFLEAVKR